ncbi:hypothetical protein [uncultured Clostridium sp.]|uniref:hypothetical protein n=1 Tax=uncultured Clostridium sp. TaxID=59620 RepID=UPI0025E5FC24|nr:hypothetical protein [uncultured Clostridium sp.]
MLKRKSCFYASNDYTEVSDEKSFNFKSFAELMSSLNIVSAFDMLLEHISQVIRHKDSTEFELKNTLQNCTYNAISNLETLNINHFEINSLKHKFFTEIN